MAHHKGLPEALVGNSRYLANSPPLTAGLCTEHCLSDGPYSNKVGAFQGAVYQNNYYRPQQRWVMLSGDTFCPVCQPAIEEIIHLCSRP